MRRIESLALGPLLVARNVPLIFRLFSPTNLATLQKVPETGESERAFASPPDANVGNVVANVRAAMFYLVPTSAFDARALYVRVIIVRQKKKNK